MVNVYNRPASGLTATYSAADITAVVAALNADADEHTTFKARENAAGRFVVVVCDENGRELGAI